MNSVQSRQPFISFRLVIRITIRETAPNSIRKRVITIHVLVERKQEISIMHSYWGKGSPGRRGNILFEPAGFVTLVTLNRGLTMRIDLSYCPNLIAQLKQAIVVYHLLFFHSTSKRKSWGSTLIVVVVVQFRESTRENRFNSEKAPEKVIRPPKIEWEEKKPPTVCNNGVLKLRVR